MSWFGKLIPSRIKTDRRTRSVPEGIWSKCPECDAVLYRAELERNVFVCPKCAHHLRIGARQRLELFLDEGSIKEIAAELFISPRTVGAHRNNIREKLGLKGKKPLLGFALANRKL